MSSNEMPGHRRTNTEIMTVRGGVFWGIVLMVFGLIWLLSAFKVISLTTDMTNIALALLVMLGGIYLLVGKLLR